MRNKLTGLIFAIVIAFVSGCLDSGGLHQVDTGGAEFSSDEDYARYDQEMADLSAGQAE